MDWWLWWTLLLFPASLSAATIYVSPTGSDLNSGAIDAPFYNISKAISLVTTGDTIYVRGGTFSYSTTIQITNSGSVLSPIKLWAYPSEHPVIDFSAMADADANRGFRITTNGANW